MVPCTSTNSTVKHKTTPKALDATIVFKNGEAEDISRLIALCLQTPPNVPESDDDLDLADKNSDEDDKQKRIHVQITIRIVFLNNQKLAQQ